MNCVFTHTFDGEVEAAQSVSRKRIGSTLEYNCTWLVHLHDFSHDLTNTHTSTTLLRQRICVWWSHSTQIKKHLQVWRWLHRTHHQYRLEAGSLLHSTFPFQLRCPAHIGGIIELLPTYAQDMPMISEGKLEQTNSPSGLQCQGSIPHTCEKRQSWLYLWCRRPPPLHHHGGCQCLCITPSGGT